MSMGAFKIQHGMLQVGGKRAWLLGSDGTDSKVWTTPNVFTLPKPTWSVGASRSGIYTLLRTTQTAGDIEIYSPGAPVGWKRTFDFRVSSFPAYFSIHPPDGGGGYGSYAAGTGFVGSSRGAGNVSVIELDLDNYTATTLTRIDVLYAMAGMTTGVDREVGPVNPWDDRTIPINGAFVIKVSPGSASISGLIQEIATLNAGDSGSATIIGIILYGTGSCPFDFCDTGGGGLSGNAVTALSTDDGSTFASPVIAGAAPGDGSGFDVQHVGTVAYASAHLTVQKASSLGGSYSTDQTFSQDPAVILVPWGKRNSIALDNTGGSPEYIVGLVAPDGSSHTLFWIVGGSPVNITPVVGGNPGIPAGPNCVTTYLGKYIAFLGTFGGGLRLVTSADGGASWVDRGALGADYARVRRLASTPGQLYLAGDALDYSNSFGASLKAKTKPNPDTLVFFEAYN